MWRHTRRGDRYVTVIIDLTPARDRSGPARLLDVIPGRSRKVLTTWPTARGQSWRERVEVVATGRFHRAQQRRQRAAPTGPGSHGSLFIPWPWPPTSPTSAAAGSSGRPQGAGPGR